MPTFAYEAMNTAGQSVKGEIDAISPEEAAAKVRAMGNFPTKVKERAARRPKAAGRSAAAAQPASGGQRRRVGGASSKLLTQFTRQLATLINAGLPILRSLRVLEQQQKPGPMRLAIRYVCEDVEGGLTLSEAMGKHPRVFDRLYTNMVRAGEVGGVLDEILEKLSGFMEKAQALRRKVIGAMIYPAAVLTFAAGIVTGLLVFVVPKFREIFAGMGRGLPKPTEILLNLSEWMKTVGWMFIVLLPLGLFLLSRLIKLSALGRYYMDRGKLMIPIFGAIVSKSSIARFTRTLGTLLAAGVPILEAITITAETAGNDVYTKALLRVREAIREGENFAEPLRLARVVDPMVVNMIDVGEETGELDRMLAKVADTYEDEVETLVSGLTSLLEPVMVITLGLIVGFIVVALFMPMVGMIQGMSSSK